MWKSQLFALQLRLGRVCFASQPSPASQTRCHFFATQSPVVGLFQIDPLPKVQTLYRIFVAFLKENELAAHASINVRSLTSTISWRVKDGNASASWRRFSPSGVRWILTPPGPAEDLRMQARFLIPGEAGEPIGRLHVDLQPAVRTSDNRPMYVLHLTARGQVSDGLEFFDIGRDWIVQTFKRLTSSSMHDVWRIKNDA